MVGTNPTLASGGMARLADRMAAMVRETVMPTLAADGIFAAAAALISIYYLMQWFQCMYLSPAPSSLVALLMKLRSRYRGTAKILDDGKTFSTRSSRALEPVSGSSLHPTKVPVRTMIHSQIKSRST